LKGDRTLQGRPRGDKDPASWGKKIKGRKGQPTYTGKQNFVGTAGEEGVEGAGVTNGNTVWGTQKRG